MIAKAGQLEQQKNFVSHTSVQNDQKPRIRITVERISVTTIRTRSEKVYCEICHRELSDEIARDRRANEPSKVIEAEATASHTENEKGEIK